VSIRFFFRSLGVVGVVGLCVLVGLFFYSSFFSKPREQVFTFVQKQTNMLVNFLNLTVDVIHVEGLGRITHKKVIRELSDLYGISIFKVDNAAIVARLQSLGWMESVIVKNIFPNSLKIVIKEYVPYALWQSGSTVFVVSEKGDVIVDADPKKFKDLPLIVGKGANVHYAPLKALLIDHPDIEALISSVQFLNGRRWRLHFTTGVIVDLPEESIEIALKKLGGMHAQQKVLYKNIAIIDMRVVDRIVLKGGIKRSQEKAKTLEKNRI
jgi:cell division protein FtsQ